MRICAVFDHSDNPVTLQDIDQLRDLSNDDIRQGLEDVKKAEQVLRAALVLDAILSKFASTSRFRNSRVEENARTVSSAQHLFTEWSPGTVYRLLLLSKPDVESIVQDSVLREGLKNRAIDYDVPASFTPKLKNYGWDTSFLRKKFRIPQDDISPFGVNCSPTEPLTQHTLEQTRCMPSGLISSNLRDTTPDHRAPSMIIPSKRRRVSIVPEDASCKSSTKRSWVLLRASGRIWCPSRKPTQYSTYVTRSIV
ncbi:hypothetical protein B0J11DRAFT_62986 [Dendryphion nanum]|uniref:Uncharacterized protein n=1 Tax=Dendryphion nanum TaxID=256645 RepID=A0A9P9IG78_9PLEO|nr:hypothetical protein B0J11DRAFT_62986 [Dendryphion nanum]